jgi:hypothetical protein
MPTHDPAVPTTEDETGNLYPLDEPGASLTDEPPLTCRSS